MAELPTFNGSWPWPCIGSYFIPSCITRRPLPTYQISLKSKKPFCGWTDGRTDIWDPLMLLGRLRAVGIKRAKRWGSEWTKDEKFRKGGTPVPRGVTGVRNITTRFTVQLFLWYDWSPQNFQWVTWVGSQPYNNSSPHSNKHYRYITETINTDIICQSSLNGAANLYLEFTKICLVAGPHLDPLGCLSAPPHPAIAGLLLRRWREGEAGREMRAYF